MAGAPIVKTPLQTDRKPDRDLTQRLAALKRRLVQLFSGRPQDLRKLSVDEILDRLDDVEGMCRQEYGHTCRIRREKRVEVTEPLVLISQIQRSGGTLLSQLFDGHPQCHAHPQELSIGYPKKMHWPDLDLDATPAGWFKMLFERPVLRAFEQGYTKYGRGIDENPEVFPFIFLPSLQKAIFDDCVRERTPRTARDVFNCYMTSYFNAWLDNQNLYAPGKRLVTAFVPRMGMDAENLRLFFQSYPDGRLLSIIRDPQSWWVSARKHKPDVYGDIDQALNFWLASTEAIRAARRQHGRSVHVLKFEDLVTDTEGTMRRLADYLGIDFDPCLLAPTFNGLPIKADSSYRVRDYGVITDPVTRHREVLTAAEVARIEELTAEAYGAALDIVAEG